MHPKNIYSIKELDESPTTKAFLVVRREGKREVKRRIRHYNLDAIISVGYPWLAVLMVLASVVGAYYYLRVVWYMYFDQPQDRSLLAGGPGHAACSA